jgi:sugar/nucleoside kinase (ribokinase family)
VLVVGDVVDDEVVRPHGPLEWGGETRADIAATPGGSAANQAAWLASLGVPVRFAGRVGAADVARHTNALGRYGVDARLTADPVAPTGRVLVVVGPDGERDMYVDAGANRFLSVADLDDGLLHGVGHAHLSGYSFFPPGPRAAVRDLAGRAAARGVTVSVDPASAAFLREVGPRAFLDWTRGAKILFPNLDEGRVLTGRTEPGEVAGALVRHYPLVVLKLGAAGVLAADRSGHRIRLPAPAVRAVDTTGAGDAFCAGFLARAAGSGAGMTRVALAARVAAGQDTALRVVTRLGARPRPGPVTAAGGVPRPADGEGGDQGPAAPGTAESPIAPCR